MPTKSASRTRAKRKTLIRSPGRDIVCISLVRAELGKQVERSGHEHGPVRACDRTRSLDRPRSEEHTSELQSRVDLVCRLLLEKKKKTNYHAPHSNKKNLKKKIIRTVSSN